MVGQFSFQRWLDFCNSDSGQSSVGGGDEVALRLRKEARLHFEGLPSSSRPSVAASVKISAPAASPSKDSTVEQDLAKASSGTPNGLLALLVSSLGPALTPSATIGRKVRALHCLMGALEGSAELTHGVRQAVGRFLVELCRPGGVENEDVEEYDEGDMNQEMDYVDADNLTPEQLTEQLEAISAKRSKRSITLLTYDDVRDAAMICLTALTRSHLEIFPTQQSQSSESKQSHCPATKALGVVHQSMEFRVELAILGVRYRCQMDPPNESNGDKGMRAGAGAGYETIDPGLNIEDGLSNLPRAKRSLCFNLFDGALDGLNDDELKCKKLMSQIQQSSSTQDTMGLMIPSSLFIQMSAFTSMTSSCMHGETDPRCLLQLLSLFNKMQRIMLPMFAFSGNRSTETANDMDIDTSKMMFPSIEIFDAVAPYYPVHFTPPKNDPHGITQGVLHDALLAVLCERGVNSDQDDDGTKETMILLAARMFLERIEPPKTSDYDPPSNGSGSDVEDKLDAVQDLSSLFLPHFTPSKATGYDNYLHGHHISLNITRVPPEFLSELSLSMARVHEEAVSSDANALASAIRKFSSCLVKSLEPATTTSMSSEVDTFSLWEAYVVDVLRHLTPILGSAPQGMHGRASTAYFASLAAEGGLMTLNKVLDGCYPRFLGVLSLLDEKDNSGVPLDVGESSRRLQTSKPKSRDEEKLAAAMRGIAALVSSCRVSLQKWQRNNFGVQIHPHPLSLYAPSTVQKILLVLNESINEDKVGSLELAAVGALESVLTSYDLNFLEEGDMVTLEESISLITHAVLVGEDSVDKDLTHMHEWNLACARALGAVISVGICQKKDAGGVIANTCERINTVATNLLPNILASATSPHLGSLKLHIIRYDWVVLAGACANGTLHVSEQIVSDLISKIITALRLNQENQKTSAIALSYIIRHGGPNVGTAFHGLSPPGSTPHDVIRELCHQEDPVARRQLQVGMSMLQLPVSRAKDEEAANETIKRAQSILPFLIPAYESPSSIASCDSLARFVNNILPPLSECDEVSLYVALPLLAAALKRFNQDSNELESATTATLVSMVEDLALFSIRSDHYAHSRSAAASCLFSVLFQSSEDNEIGCASLLKKLMEDVVSPVLTTALSCLDREVSETPTPRASGGVDVAGKSLPSVFAKVEDTLSFMSVLGSAAACKGGSFSQIGDRIALFLIELACTGASHYPFSGTTAIQLTTPSQQGQKHPLLNPASHAFILPASALGSMLSVNNGGSFWRQRLTHKTLPILLGALNAQSRSQNPPALGTLCVVCHMLCCLPTSLLGEANMKQMIPTLVAGLVYFSKNSDAMAQSEMITSKPMKLLSIILAALLKILTVSPEDGTKFIGIIIPSLLLLCSTNVESSEECIPSCLLVFQCLESVAAHPHVRNSILREKDQVIAILSAVIDHPSAAVRNAVVQARNVWYTLA